MTGHVLTRPAIAALGGVALSYIYIHYPDHNSMLSIFRNTTRSTSELIKTVLKPLPDIQSPEFARAFDSYASSKIVLIGDASHGTSEFYRARAAITKRLIQKHGFNIVAIEADWPDAKAIDSYVRYRPSKKTGALEVFNRFPLWTWRNTEVQEFVDWLRIWNAEQKEKNRVRFIGLDLYSMGKSIKAVIAYLDVVHPKLAQLARKRYVCLHPCVEDPAKYGLAVAQGRTSACESNIVKVLKDLSKERARFTHGPDEIEAFLDAEMNARLVKDAEEYYRAMFSDDGRTDWNLRDTHMFHTLQSTLERTPGSKAVVWAHNSHLGDARASSMSWDRGELNLGQLCREKYVKPGEVSILGCGTHSGTVAAADEWDDPMEVMTINPSKSGSWERILHDTGVASFLLDLREHEQNSEVIVALRKPLLQRFIGVLYRPKKERRFHYMKTIPANQYDGFIWFDETSAVNAFDTAQPQEATSKGETYPFGV